jgi:uncharacterized protein with PQ loop repeat
MQSIGNITLNLSLTVYLVWFVPQIILNFKRKDTEGLSMLMHGILCIGYLSDLMYGFGRDMQWQYRLVTIVGLCSLSIQHYQFGRYGLHRATEKYPYFALNVVYMALLIYVINVLILGVHSKAFYNHAGMLANACWFSYMLPQIIKNYRNQSTTGLSLGFVLLGLFLNVCDMTSAWTLGWDYPSKIGPAVTLLGNLFLLSQVFSYAKRRKKWQPLIINSSVASNDAINCKLLFSFYFVK